jgi:peroxiredoxin
MSNPFSTIESLQSSSEFLFVVFYRGHWCPFCNAYLKDFQNIKEAIQAAHGVAVTITSEHPSHLEAMQSQTGFTGEMIADPENTIAAEFKKRHRFTPAISKRRAIRTAWLSRQCSSFRRTGQLCISGLLSLLW